MLKLYYFRYIYIIMKNFKYLSILLILFGCNFSSNKIEPVLETDFKIKDSSKTNFDSIIITNTKPNYSDSINFTDSNGLKQGQWIRKWKGKLVEKYTYVNDTLNGHYETDHGEGFYLNGKKEGFQYTYYGEKESILMISYFEKGNKIWSGFPTADREYLIPIKGFHISKDSIYIEAPDINNQIWYKGNFFLYSDIDNTQRTYAYGVHKIYHRNGNLKGIVNYSIKTIMEYDSLGNLLYETTFNQHKIHQQPITSFYLQ